MAEGFEVGPCRFELDAGWAGTSPPGIVYGWTHGVAVDDEDNVYVHHRGESPVCVFDAGGALIHRFGDRFREGAHGLTLAREAGRQVLWFADPEHGAVVKTTLDGQELLELETPRVDELYFEVERPPNVWPPPGVYAPTDVAVATDGTIYVTDGYGAFAVHRYAPSGTHLGWWGGHEQFDQPHGLEVIGERVWVADRANERILVFALDGAYVEEIAHGVGFVCDVVGRGEDVWLPDLHSRVSLLRPDGEPVHMGRDQEVWRREGWPHVDLATVGAGSFVAPHALAFDRGGNLYVAEWVASGRVRKFCRVG